MNKFLIITDCRECPYQSFDTKKLTPICNLTHYNVLGGQSMPISKCLLKDFEESMNKISNEIESLVCCGGDWEKTVEKIRNIFLRKEF